MSELKDLKEALSSSRKPDLTHVRTVFMTYTARPCAYGGEKYQRANYLRPVSPNGYTGTPTRADFERLRAYLRACQSHVNQVLDAMELHQSRDPELVDVEGMTRAAYAVDIDPDTTGKVGPSFLPHVAPACASLMMAISQAVACGLLPADPGQPWSDDVCASAVAEIAREKWFNASRRPQSSLEVIVKEPARMSDEESDEARVRAEVAELDREIESGFSGRIRSEGVRQ